MPHRTHERPLVKPTPLLVGRLGRTALSPPESLQLLLAVFHACRLGVRHAPFHGFLLFLLQVILFGAGVHFVGVAIALVLLLCLLRRDEVSGDTPNYRLDLTRTVVPRLVAPAVRSHQPGQPPSGPVNHARDLLRLAGARDVGDYMNKVRFEGLQFLVPEWRGVEVQLRHGWLAVSGARVVHGPVVEWLQADFQHGFAVWVGRGLLPVHVQRRLLLELVVEVLRSVQEVVRGVQVLIVVVDAEQALGAEVPPHACVDVPPQIALLLRKHVHVHDGGLRIAMHVLHRSKTLVLYGQRVHLVRDLLKPAALWVIRPGVVLQGERKSAEVPQPDVGLQTERDGRQERKLHLLARAHELQTFDPGSALHPVLLQVLYDWR
mmetsp:Transcript_4392/g.10740  ORF Transcript_4392/g.10740 Transcript_4392/m.10740 type:complete len:376 (-) Transcript_4392:572-1699(-)